MTRTFKFEGIICTTSNHCGSEVREAFAEALIKKVQEGQIIQFSLFGPTEMVSETPKVRFWNRLPLRWLCK